MLTSGSASTSTGMAGRMKSAILMFFSTFPTDYTSGSVGQKGLDSFAQGLVDAFNIDKLGVIQRDAPASAYSGTQISL
jgi:hypothetical protein